MLCLVIYALCDTLVVIIRKTLFPWQSIWSPRQILHSRFRFLNYRIIQVGRSLWSSSVPPPQTWVIGKVQSGLEDLQGHRRCCLGGQPVPWLVLDISLSAAWIVTPFVSRPPASVCSLAPSSQWPAGTARLPFGPAAFVSPGWTKPAYQPLLAGQVLQPLATLVAPAGRALVNWCPFPTWRAQTGSSYCRSRVMSAEQMGIMVSWPCFCSCSPGCCCPSLLPGRAAGSRAALRPAAPRSCPAELPPSQSPACVTARS